MEPGNQRSKPSRTSPRLRMKLVRLLLPTSITSPELRMTAGRLTLLPSSPKWTLRTPLGPLKTRMLKENAYLKTLAAKTLGVAFNAYRTKAYDGGGEENLTFQGAYTNIGGGLDIDTGIFTCPIGGTYIFQFHIATHDNKKALLSIRKNGEEIASIFDQNHKDNHKNSMAGQSIILDVKKGDEIVVYAYTGTWLADFPMNHYTHWVGLLLKPSQEEIDEIYSKAGEAEVPVENGF